MKNKNHLFETKKNQHLPENHIELSPCMSLPWSPSHTQIIPVAFMKSLFHWNYIFSLLFRYNPPGWTIFYWSFLLESWDCNWTQDNFDTRTTTQIKNVHTLNAMSNHIVVVIRNEHKKWNRKKLLRKCEKTANLKRKRSEWTILVNFNHFQYFCLSHDICTCWAERWF